MDPEVPNRMADNPETEILIELSQAIEWRTSTGVIDYPHALNFMEERADDIHGGNAPETVWLLEHPPLYTAGTSADKKDLLTPDRFEVRFGTSQNARGNSCDLARTVFYLNLRGVSEGGSIPSRSSTGADFLPKGTCF